jgi:hypothetical protein
VPIDNPGMQKAISAQRPVVADSGSRAGRALLSLAEILNEGKLQLADVRHPRAKKRSWWRLFARRRPGPAARSVAPLGAELPPAPERVRSRAW